MGPLNKKKVSYGFELNYIYKKVPVSAFLNAVLVDVISIRPASFLSTRPLFKGFIQERF